MSWKHKSPESTDAARRRALRKLAKLPERRSTLSPAQTAFTPEKSERLDLGLAISGATLKPGECRSLTQIASYCDCSMQMISIIELRALDKLRRRLKQLLEAEELQAWNERANRREEFQYHGHGGS